MLNPFICGGAFPDDEESDGGGSPLSNSPRKSRRNSFCRRSSHSHRDASKNPYSTRGLDKFSQLLADLEEKRQKIYAQIGADDISFVRFAYRNSDHCVPIVVKLKDKDHLKTQTAKIKRKQETKPQPQQQQQHAEAAPPPPASAAAEKEAAEIRETKPAGSDRKLRRLLLEMLLGRLRRPSHYVPAVVIMILLLLTVFGRSVAIMCTSIAWYAVPTIGSGGGMGSDTRKPPAKRKELRRRFSENKMATHDKLPMPRGGNRISVSTGNTRASSPVNPSRQRKI